MNDNTRKLILYLQPTFTYWKLRDPADYLSPKKYKLGFYPLSFKKRLFEKHYLNFDEQGLPLSGVINGDLAHHVTTISSFSFANWELFLETGDEKYSKLILQAADYFLSKARYHDTDRATILWYFDKTETDGKNCGMDQGEAISVLVRAYCITQNNSYLKLASDISASFLHGLNEKGVSENIPGTNDPWFLEGEKFILNGHIYALVGLWELWRVSGEQEHYNIFKLGYDSVVKHVDLFDKKYWSIYMLEDKKYLASMMYHNLHICQLRILNQLESHPVLISYAGRFEKYAGNIFYRLLAGYNLFSSKIRRMLAKNKIDTVEEKQN